MTVPPGAQPILSGLTVPLLALKYTLYACLIVFPRTVTSLLIEVMIVVVPETYQYMLLEAEVPEVYAGRAIVVPDFIAFGALISVKVA